MTDFSNTRAMFHIPEGMTYLNGNSLGPMPRDCEASILNFLNDEWKTELIKGWNRLTPSVIALAN
jgi:kynureninase